MLVFRKMSNFVRPWYGKRGGSGLTRGHFARGGAYTGGSNGYHRQRGGRGAGRGRGRGLHGLKAYVEERLNRQDQKISAQDQRLAYVEESLDQDRRAVAK